MREQCGLVGISSQSYVSKRIFFGLKVIQHRGQEAAGIAVAEGETIRWHKGAGLVHEVFDSKILDELTGKVGLGHVRYSTTGMKTAEEAHPILASTTKGDIAICHNGELTNTEVLKSLLRKKGTGLETLSDTEIIVRMLAGELDSCSDPTRALSRTLHRLQGAYSLAILIGDRLFAARDPYGIRPLCLGKTKDGHVIASETAVLDLLEAEFVKDLGAGEILEVGRDIARSYHMSVPKHTAHCIFEYVYFSRPDNVLDGRLVYDVRRKIGESLAENDGIKADCVIPVPDSGRSHASGYADKSGLPLVEGLIKNRFVERTFILPEQREREVSVLLKLNPVKSLVEGRSVVVIDDSIIRGTTMRKIVQILKRAGAKKVHVRIGCPPIRHPCYLGIDMKTRAQFIAHEKSVSQIAKEIGSDSLTYLSIDSLVDAIGHPREELCLGCLTGEYPLEVKGEKVRQQETLEDFE